MQSMVFPSQGNFPNGASRSPFARAKGPIVLRKVGRLGKSGDHASRTRGGVEKSKWRQGFRPIMGHVARHTTDTTNTQLIATAIERHARGPGRVQHVCARYRWRCDALLSVSAAKDRPRGAGAVPRPAAQASSAWLDGPGAAGAYAQGTHASCGGGGFPSFDRK